MSRRSYFNFLAVGLLWGIPYLLLKIAVKEIQPTVIVFARVLIGACVLIPLAIRQGSFSLSLKNWRYVIPYAALEMIGPWILITTAEQKLNSGLAGLLVATVPIWSTLITSLQGDRSAWHKKRLFGLVIGFLGLVLVVGIESLSQKQSTTAIGMILLAAMGYAYAPIRVNQKIPHVDGMAINGFAMLTTAIFYLPFAIVQAPNHLPSTKAISAVVGLGLFSTAFAFIYFFKLMRDIGPARASLVTYVNTAFAVILGVIILGEPLTLGIALGLPLVLIGSYFASRKSALTSQ